VSDDPKRTRKAGDRATVRAESRPQTADWRQEEICGLSTRPRVDRLHVPRAKPGTGREGRW
jgi:hypothetical protein